MTPESQELQKNIDNLHTEVLAIHLMVQKIRRQQIRDVIWGYVKLTIIVVPLVVGYFWFQPQLTSLLNTYQQVQQQFEKLQQTPFAR